MLAALAEGTTLWSGDLATPRRTVLGVLAHIDRLELPPDRARRFLIESGLPPVAFEEPDVPITIEQELVCTSRIVAALSPARSIERHALELGLQSLVTHFGVLGLTMMYAPSIVECVRALVSYPELCWGHSRVSMRVGPDGIYHAFSVDSEMPAEVDNAEAVRRYLVTVDLTASVRVYGDIFGAGYRPRAIHLPYPAPRDRRAMVRAAGCPVVFDAPEARIDLPESILEARPLLANPFAFRTYERLTAQLARMLRADVSLTERVKRQLRTTAPPPDRERVASMLGMSARSLARKLAREGTSYAELHREVRLARAKEHLESRELQIGEIAARLGFSDATAFSRAFRSWVGETPSAWRSRQRAG